LHIIYIFNAITVEANLDTTGYSLLRFWRLTNKTKLSPPPVIKLCRL